MPSLLLMLLPLICAAIVWAAPVKTVTLSNTLGLDWSHELVHYDLEFPAGQVKDAAVAVKAGNAGIPGQVSAVTRHADGSIKSCTAWFFANVPAGATMHYTLTPGVAGAQFTGKGAQVTETADTVTLATATPEPVGIRLPRAAKILTQPISAADAPGPIQGLLLPSGKVTGQGRLNVPFMVKSYATEVLANGPLFAEARVTYTFDTGYWTFTARVIDGCPTVIVREEFNTGFSGQGASAADRFYTLTLDGGNFAPTQFFFGGRTDQPAQATLVKEGKRPEWKAFNIADNWFASAVQGGVLPKGDAQELYRLTGYPSVIPRVGCLARVQEAGGDAVGFVGLDTAFWRDPLSIRLRATAAGQAQLCFPLQVYRQEWAVDGFGRGTPNYTGKTLGVPEYTARRCYGIMLSPAVHEETEMLASLFRQASMLDALALDTIKDWVLELPDPMAGAVWAGQSSANGTKALETMRSRLKVTRTFGQLARFSMAYHYGFTKHEYDGIQAVMDSTTDLSAADRAELRRLAAWNAYDMNAVATFPWGTGFHLNNPNMTIMALEARVKSSLLVKDHPQFRSWGAWSLTSMQDFNRRFTRDSGALYENPHYSLGVTLDWQAQVNKVFMDAGLGDAFDNPLFTRSMRFIMDWLTPPDPRFLGHRLILPIGNCSYQSMPPSMANQYVAYYKDRNPEMAGQLQWMANQTLPADKQIKQVKDVVPQLGSTWYQDFGVYFRHGFGTPYETLFMLFAGNCDGHCEWEQDQMSYTLYAKGQPINLHFGNGYFPIFGRPWLRNRVSIDHQIEQSERNITEVRTAMFAPEMEYAHATREIDSLRPLTSEYPRLDGARWTAEESADWPSAPVWRQIPMTKWHRQVLFMKDTDPKGPNYFVLRETFSGTPTKPTDLSLWFLSKEMTHDGDVYHFDGQCEVDMDVFVAQPAGTEPETGKYGHVQQPYVRLVGFDPKYHPEGKLQETQQFLRLKQPAGKGYMVVLYPRLKAGDPAATFTRLAESVVKVETPLSTDYVIADRLPLTFTDGKVQFRGTAGSVRFYRNGRIVVTSTEGHAVITVAGKTITGDGAFTATIDHGKVFTSLESADAKVNVE